MIILTTSKGHYEVPARLKIMDGHKIAVIKKSHYNKAKKAIGPIAKIGKAITTDGIIKYFVERG